MAIPKAQKKTKTKATMLDDLSDVRRAPYSHLSLKYPVTRITAVGAFAERVKSPSGGRNTPLCYSRGLAQSAPYQRIVRKHRKVTAPRPYEIVHSIR